MYIKTAFLILLCGVFSCSSGIDRQKPDDGKGDVPEEIRNDTTCWYIDSNYIGEKSDGSLYYPFKSLDAINSVKTDRDIKLKCGSSFKGSIRLIGVNGITVTSYGKGDKPKIDGNNLTGSAIVYIKNCSNVTVSNLELFDSDTLSRGDKRGVLIDSDPTTLTTYSNITVEDLYIHDIFGTLDEEGRGGATAAKKCGGIHLWTSSGFGRYDNILIRNNRIKSIDCNGISTWRSPATGTAGKISPYSDEFKTYAHTNVRITGNVISDTGKNSLFIRNLYGGSVDHNIWYDNSYRCHAGNAICTSYVDGVIIEYNEGFLNRANTLDGKAYQDGCMLDADLQSRNVIFQYNLSHDNTFGLFLNCTGKTKDDPGANDNIIVRYNLSVNDIGADRGIIHVNYYVGDLQIYNNTIITREGAAKTRIFHAKANRGPYRFFNNLIVDRSDSGVFIFDSDETGKFSNNCYYSTKGNAADSKFKSYNTDGIYANPKLKGPVPTDTSGGIIGIENVDFGKIESGSPCLGAGQEVQGIGQDFFGNTYNKSIGCCCKP